MSQTTDADRVFGVPIGKVRDTLRRIAPAFEKEREIRRRTDVVLSSSFNVFDYVVDRRSEKGEIMLSNVLAMMLDSDGDHGQGDLFQKRYIAMVKQGVAEKASCAEVGLGGCPDSGYAVRVEEGFSIAGSESSDRASGRIDLMLHHPGGSIVGIENKPFAGDQPLQAKRYLDHLAERANAEHGLVYLSGTGLPPSPASLSSEDRKRASEEGRLCIQAYRSDVVTFIESCARDCRSPRFASFLDDFAGYVSRRFGGRRTAG